MTGTFEEMIERCVHIVDEHGKTQRSDKDKTTQRSEL